MKLIEISTEVKNSIQNIKNGFNKSLFKKLTPPGVKVDLLRFDGCSQGDEVHLSISNLLMKEAKWISLISEEVQTSEMWKFVDVGKVLPWPLKTWEHHHIVKMVNDKVYIVDQIQYSCGNSILEVLFYLPLYLQFYYRKPIYRKEFNQ